jgi:DNA polymerase-1
MSKDELFLIDGSGFIFRAYYAMAYSNRGAMTNPAGVPVSAVYGFTSMLLKMLRDYHAPYLAVVFDTARKNFRNDIYPEYKANRQETPEDLIPQFPLIRDAVRAFDIPALELDGYEADDLIAAYTAHARKQGKNVVIVSSDKDLMQLVGAGVRLLDPMKGEWMGEAQVLEKFGVTPDKVVDVQSLAGDSSDNVPGVPGIGIKTAAQLINEYGSLENLLARASEIKQDKRRESLITFAEQARISKRLVQLDAGAPLPLPLDDLKTHDPDKPELVNFLRLHGFQSILKRLDPLMISRANEAAMPSPPTPPHAGGIKREIDAELPAIDKNEYTLITSLDVLEDWIKQAEHEGVLAIDTETTSLTPAKANLVGISLCVQPGQAAYIPLGHVQETDLLGDRHAGMPAQLPLAKVMAALKPLLENPSVLKIGHNIKYDWQMFAKAGIRMTPCDDTMLISYVLDGSSQTHGMDALSARVLHHKPISYEDVTGKGKNQIPFDRVAIDKALSYAAEDADITRRLHIILKQRLIDERMVSVYEDIERPLIPVIADMELTGITVDPQVLKTMSAEFARKLSVLETEIHALAGHEFNIASPKQVGAVLFGEMGLEGGKKTKTGEWSTAVDVLEKLADEGHAIALKILEHRQLSKLKSTYTDALQEQVNPRTARVHTSFAMAHTNTGRLSSSDPNLQNIPIRSEEGKRIREAFIAPPGHVLLSVDYSQVELRLAAALAGIEALKSAFEAGTDIHALTAAQVFDLPLEQVTPELRRQAKAVNFGIIYGISGWGLAKQLGCSQGEANDFIRRYMTRFPELQRYMDAKKDEARALGYVKTLMGRKCFISGIHDKNGAVRGFAERQAINAPLQGTAADIMKIAMARLPRALGAAGLNAKLLLQVHDELVLEVPETELEMTKTLAQSVMEQAAGSGLKLKADAGAGSSWAAAH